MEPDNPVMIECAKVEIAASSDVCEDNEVRFQSPEMSEVIKSHLRSSEEMSSEENTRCSGDDSAVDQENETLPQSPVETSGKQKRALQSFKMPNIHLDEFIEKSSEKLVVAKNTHTEAENSVLQKNEIIHEVIQDMRPIDKFKDKFNNQVRDMAQKVSCSSESSSSKGLLDHPLLSNQFLTLKEELKKKIQDKKKEMFEKNSKSFKNFSEEEDNIEVITLDTSSSDSRSTVVNSVIYSVSDSDEDSELKKPKCLPLESMSDDEQDDELISGQQNPSFDESQGGGNYPYDMFKDGLLSNSIPSYQPAGGFKKQEDSIYCESSSENENSTTNKGLFSLNTNTNQNFSQCTIPPLNDLPIPENDSVMLTQDVAALCSGTFAENSLDLLNDAESFSDDSDYKENFTPADEKRFGYRVREGQDHIDDVVELSGDDSGSDDGPEGESREDEDMFNDEELSPGEEQHQEMNEFGENDSLDDESYEHEDLNDEECQKNFDLPAGQDYIDDEAELSGDDGGSDDGPEDESREDEDMFNDEELPPDEEQRQKITELHAKRMHDEDIQDIRNIKERFFLDGELGDGTGRSRKFVWTNAAATTATHSRRDSSSDADADDEDEPEPADSYKLKCDIEKSKWKIDSEEKIEDVLLNADNISSPKFVKLDTAVTAPKGNRKKRSFTSSFMNVDEHHLKKFKLDDD